MVKGRMLFAVVVAAGLPIAAAGQTTNWQDALDGDWLDALRWDNGVPGPGFDVVIDATGAAYTSRVTLDFSINDLTLNSADALLLLQNGSRLDLGGTANLLAGEMRLNNAEIVGGTINTAPGMLSFSSSTANILDGVSVVGDLDLNETSSTVRLRSGTTLSGAVNLAGNSVRLGFDGTQTFGGEIVQSTGNLASLTVEQAGSELTLANSALVRGTRMDIGNAFAVGGAGRSIVNQGEIRAEASNSTGVRAVSVDTFTNEGTLRATNGGRLQVNTTVDSFDNDGVFLIEAGSRGDIEASNWTNSGTISVTDGLLALSGSYSTSGIGLNAGRISGNAGATLSLGGSIDNSGAMILSDDFGGTINYAGATLTGGSLQQLMPEQFVFSSSTSNIFDGVSVLGDLTLGGSSSTLRLRSNSSVSGAVNLTGNSSRLGFDGTQTFDGEIVQSTGTVGSVTVEQAGSELTLGNSALVRGTRMDIGNAFAAGGAGRSIVNQGEIRAEASNSTGVRVVSVDSFTNSGTVRATGGGRLQVISTVDSFDNDGMIVVEAGSRGDIAASNWTNNGSANVSDGLLALSGSYSTGGIGLDAGRIMGNTGATLSLGGSIDNSGAMIRSDDFGGTINYAGATLTGGSLQQLMPEQFVFSSSTSNIFDGVSVLGDLTLGGSNSTLRLRNGTSVSGVLNLTGNSARLGFDGMQTFDGEIVQSTGIVGSVTVEQAGSELTLGNSALIRGTRMDIGSAFAVGGAGRTIVNQGEIRAESANSTGIRVVSVDTFTNEGTLRATNGGRLQILSSVDSFANDGMFLVEAGSRGDIAANNWTNNGTINVTDGLLVLSGSFSTGAVGLNAGRITGNAGSMMTLSADIDNAGETLRSDDFGGTITYSGATLTGGSIQQLMPEQFVFSSSTTNIFDGVSVLGDLTLGQSNSTLRVRNGSSVTGVIGLEGNGARLGFEGTQTFDGEIAQSTGNSAQLTIEQSGTELTLSGSSLVRGTRLDIGSAFAFGGAGRSIVNRGEIRAEAANVNGVRVVSIDSLDNEGEIMANASGSRVQILSSVDQFSNSGTVAGVAGSQLDIDAANWTNELGGVISTDGGTLNLDGQWTNLGQINAVGGTLDLGGSFTTAGSGLQSGGISRTAATDFRLSGSLDNSAEALLDSTSFGGTLTVSGGEILGGTLTVSDTSDLAFSSSTGNAFDGLEVIGDLDLGLSSSTLRIRNGTSVSGDIFLSGNGARLGLEGSQTVVNDIISSASSSMVTIEGVADVVFGVGTTVSGPRIDIGSALALGGERSLTVNGTVSANAANATGIRFVSVDTLTNNGVFEANNGGRLSVFSSVDDFTNLNMGTLTGGTYRVGAGSRMDLNDQIVVSNADIELLGAGAQFDGLEALARNEGSLTIGGGASLALDGDVEFAATSSLLVLVEGMDDSILVPMIDANGSATLGGDLALDFTGYSGITAGTFRFLDADAFVGDWASLSVVGINPDLIVFDAGPGAFTLLIPAPGTGAAFGLLGLVAARRRRG